MAVSSSLNSIHISPRTPKTPKTAREDDEGVELSLLQEDERRESEFDVSEQDESSPTKRKISASDKRGMVLLCVLCELDCPCMRLFRRLNIYCDRLDSGSAGTYLTCTM